MNISFTSGLTHRDRLKAATVHAHQATEERWFASGSFACRESYDRWLNALCAAHQTFGASAVSHPHLSTYASTEADRLDALCHDLQRHDWSKDKTPAGDESWSWGVLYALNGSALGASSLLKSGAVHADWPRRYLSEMRSFAVSGGLKTFFDQLNAGSKSVYEMVEGANDVFSFLARQS